MEVSKKCLVYFMENPHGWLGVAMDELRSHLIGSVGAVLIAFKSRRKNRDDFGEWIYHISNIHM